jgi:cytochrome c-type biogenesis protein CcmH/NrfG
MDPARVKKLYYDGVALYTGGRIREAIAVWEQVLAQDPLNAGARKNIENAQAKLKRLEEGEE